MMEPRISVIVPIYNVELYINNCIDSILKQTFSNFELILVNDGSTDKCGEICNEYSRIDNRVKVIHKKNGGISSARNIGITNSIGNYICFIDPDDTIQPNMLEKLIETALNHKADIVVCPIKTINFRTGTVSISEIWQESNFTIDKDTIEKNIIPTLLKKSKYFSLLSSCNKLYKKNLFNYYNLKFDENRDHGEDARLNLILLTKIETLVFIDSPLYNYYIRNENSLTQRFRENLYEYILDNKNFGIFLCKKYHLEDVIEKILEDFIISSLNFMQEVVNSSLQNNKKHKILKEIMDDIEFKECIKNCYCSSIFYKMLKIISIKRKVGIFIKLVHIKNVLKINLSKVV